jgi:hypothetical protein
MTLLPGQVFRTPCPAGACDCQYELLDAPDADARVRLLTAQQEKALIARIERIHSLEDMMRVIGLIYEQLGVRMTVEPGGNEVRTVRGLHIELEPLPGLCKKTRASLPQALRRCLDANQHIVYELLDRQSLWGRG